MGSLQCSTDSVGGFEGEGKGETEEKGNGNVMKERAENAQPERNFCLRFRDSDAKTETVLT